MVMMIFYDSCWCSLCSLLLRSAMTTNRMMIAAQSAVRRNVSRKVSPIARPRSSSFSSSQSSLSTGTSVALGMMVVIGPTPPVICGRLVRTGRELSAGLTTVATGSGSDGTVDEGAGEGEGDGMGEGEGEGGVVLMMTISATMFFFTSLSTPLPENCR